MITYEVNIVCDRCKSEYVGGDSSTSVKLALDFTENKAKHFQWIKGGKKWLCPDCQTVNERKP